MGLRTLIATALNLPNERVREEFSKSLNDKTGFITVAVLTDRQIGREYKFTQNEVEIITSTREATISINAFGKNSLALIGKLNTLFYSSFFIQSLNGKNLSLVSVSPIRNLTLGVGGASEERANLDVVMSYNNRVEVSQNEIKKTDDIFIRKNRWVWW